MNSDFTATVRSNCAFRRMAWRCRAVGAERSERDGAGDRRRGRPAGRAHGAAEGPRRGRASSSTPISRAPRAARSLARCKAAMCFHWKALRRQVRVRGPVEIGQRRRGRRLLRQSRPRGSRIGAWASKQSRPLESRFALEKAVAEYTAEISPSATSPARLLVGLPHQAGRRSSSGRTGRSACTTASCSARKGDGWEKTRLYP